MKIPVTIKNLLLFFALFYFQKNDAQTLRLEIILTNFQKKIDITYLEKHQDSLAVKKEIELFSNKLLEKGYFFHQIDSIVIKDNLVKTYVNLKSKFSNLKIRLDDEEIKTDFKHKTNNDYLTIQTDSVSKTLQIITQNLQKRGKPFSKVYLKKFTFKDSVVYASLKIEDEKVRKIDKIIIRGYESFPKKYLSRLISSKELYNQDYVLEINDRINQLDFVKTTKNPEVLFTNDSTYLYMYIEKSQNSTIDANINFTSSNENQFAFNGKIDLELINIFNKGNRYNLFWNSVSKSIQSFELSSEMPYVFNSKFTPFIKFSIFKQDSTFVNTNFNLELHYNLKNKASITAIYESENSNSLLLNSDITSFEKNYFGVGFDFYEKHTNKILQTKFENRIKILFGNRNSNNAFTKQIRINANTSYLWEFSKRNFLFSKIELGYLSSDDYLQNELFRIGGANSIRGFAEQSIYTKKFIASTIEYRFLTNSTSYLYSITDLGWVSSISNTHLFATGLGLGYLFTSNNSTINLAFAVNKTSNKSFDFKNSQLIIGWKNYF